MTASPVDVSIDPIASPGRPSQPPPAGVGRLLSAMGDLGRAVSLDEHLQKWGPCPFWKGASFLDELDRSGLRGHGGAWFPVGTKWRSVRRSGLRSPVVVANGAEGEPASGKDRLLLHHLPHLVLDGAAVAAACVGASQILVHAPESAVPVVARAIDERRRRRLDQCPIDVVVASDRFLAGQESAVVNAINSSAPAVPSFTALRPVRKRGVAGRPTLVQNVESLAHVSLIARFGADWFRRIGREDSPGTMLLTVTGRWSDPRIIEAPLGIPLGEALGLRAIDSDRVQGVLLGGYGGGWITAGEAFAMPLTEESARALGSSLGPGVVVLLPPEVCPLVEVSRVVRYLEGQGAGQCGPCVNGLDALASAVEQLAVQPRSVGDPGSMISALCSLVEGRGACRHPDGVARFVRSASRVFDDHIRLHLRDGPCPTTTPAFLPLPGARRRPVR